MSKKRKDAEQVFAENRKASRNSGRFLCTKSVRDYETKTGGENSSKRRFGEREEGFYADYLMLKRTMFHEAAELALCLLINPLVQEHIIAPFEERANKETIV